MPPSLPASLAHRGKERKRRRASERVGKSGERGWWKEKPCEGPAPANKTSHRPTATDAILARRAEGSQAREDAMQTAIRCKTGDGREAKG
mmetsp:Transcript_1085/g.1563  ORF Transcript_1085/g.1563 Transcript_1085/m.1563 type:complete len:90 (-) Transcript_1085:260-529(-)